MDNTPNMRYPTTGLPLTPAAGSRQEFCALSSQSWILAISIILAAGLFSLGTFCSYWAEHRTDQYQLIYLGFSTYCGGQPYLDWWENKPPGIAWISALGYAATRGDQLGAWLAPGVVGFLGLLFFGWTVRRICGSVVASIALLLGTVIFTHRRFDGTSVNPDFYSSILDLAACSAWIISLHTGRRRRMPIAWVSALLAGMLFAASATVRQTGVVGLVAITAVSLPVLILGRSTEKRRNIDPLITTWLGFILGAGAVVAVLFMQGVLGPAWNAIALYNQRYVHEGDWRISLSLFQRLWARLDVMALPLWLAGLGCLATWTRTGKKRFPPSVVITLALWWAGQSLLALKGPAGSMRYWQVTWPPMLWLAVPGIDGLKRLSGAAAKNQRLAWAAVILTLVALLGSSLIQSYLHGVAASHLAYLDDTNERRQLALLSERIRQKVPEGEKLFVWAYDPGIYLYSRRHSSIPYTHPKSAQQLAAMFDMLDHNPPFALLTREKSTPMFDRWCDDTCRATLHALITERFTKDDRLGDYTLWVRK